MGVLLYKAKQGPPLMQATTPYHNEKGRLKLCCCSIPLPFPIKEKIMCVSLCNHLLMSPMVVHTAKWVRLHHAMFPSHELLLTGVFTLTIHNHY